MKSLAHGLHQRTTVPFHFQAHNLEIEIIADFHDGMVYRIKSEASNRCPEIRESRGAVKRRPFNVNFAAIRRTYPYLESHVRP